MVEVKQVYVGARVRTKARRGLGTVTGHHPTLPAWRVTFPQDRTQSYFWYESTLEVIA